MIIYNYNKNGKLQIKRKYSNKAKQNKKEVFYGKIAGKKIRKKLLKIRTIKFGCL